MRKWTCEEVNGSLGDTSIERRIKTKRGHVYRSGGVEFNFCLLGTVPHRFKDNPRFCRLQLFQCARVPLGNLLLKSNQLHCCESDLLAAMEIFAVIRVSNGAQRADLMKLSQDGDESIRKFASRVQGKVQTCGFVTQAKCK